jgi:hypothetical protein
MKTTLAAVLLAITCPVAALADFTIVQKVEAAGETQEMLMRVKGDKIRMDVGEQMSVVLDAANGDMLTLMHPQKMAMKSNQKQMQGLMAMAGAALGKKDEEVEKPRATGEREKAAGYDCEIYTWKSSTGEGKFWVAKDFPKHKELATALDKITGSMGEALKGMTPMAEDFPGMVVKAEVQSMGQKSKSELISVSEDPVDATIFATPAGYQEMAMPGIPGVK